MPNPGDKLRDKKSGNLYQFDGRGWVNLGPVPRGVQAAPEYGAGAYKAPDGSIMSAGKDGAAKVVRAAPQEVDASQRGRMNMGLAPMIQANQDMTGMERGGNPLQRDWGATMLGSVDIPVPFTEGKTFSPFDDLAKTVGGQDYQDYTQAAATFESQLMPIMSGAAVSPSEAQRQIRAALPQLGDSPQTLAKKARMRQQMLNGAAKSMGQPLPYATVPTYGVNTTSIPQAPGGGAPADPLGIRKRR